MKWPLAAYVFFFEGQHASFVEQTRTTRNQTHLLTSNFDQKPPAGQLYLPPEIKRQAKRQPWEATSGNYIGERGIVQRNRCYRIRQSKPTVAPSTCKSNNTRCIVGDGCFYSAASVKKCYPSVKLQASMNIKSDTIHVRVMLPIIFPP